ncbi:MAG: ABC transporter permease [Bradymonadales bacterium]|jgi:phospholipid/cholesterol/gamma-HCH transport system permease protein
MLRIELERYNQEAIVRLSGRLCRAEAEARGAELLALAGLGRVLRLELGALEEVDSFGAASIAALARRAAASGCELRLEGASELVRGRLERFLWGQQKVKKRRGLADILEGVGEGFLAHLASLKAFLYLVSDTVLWSIAGAARTQRVRRGAVWLESVRIGLDALGIVCLIAFLVGTVVALQSASILRMFGADILVADMIGISMTREMAPLMTAILMAGRSGASIAAQIATMNINEEISGLRTMGLEPVKYVVVPKFRAITLTMPGLTIFANFCGIFGGFIVAVLYMELGISAFLHELSQALYVKDILTSLLKSVVFAWIIVWIAAHKGFQAYGGSDSVGRVTTSSVVASIFWCIVADAVFSLIFYF